MTIGPGFAHKARIEIACENPRNVIEAMKPDYEDTPRFRVLMSSKNNKLILDIESEDVSAMTAAINSYLRLVKSVEKL